MRSLSWRFPSWGRQGGGCVKSSLASAPDQSRLETERGFANYVQSRNVRVSRIDEKVTLRGNQRRWDAQEASRDPIEPGVAEPLKRGGRGIPAPSARQRALTELLYRDSLWDLDLDRDQVRRNEVWLAVHEDLETRQRQGFGCVADQATRRVPTRGSEEPAPTVEWAAGEGLATKPKDPHYAYKP